jgi:hypothetical protein
VNHAPRAAMARPLELANAARQLRNLPPEVVSQIAIEALCRVPVVSLVWQQATFCVAAMATAEATASAFMSNPEALRRAAAAAEAGAPWHPWEAGLTVDQFLATLGAEVHRT